MAEATVTELPEKGTRLRVVKWGPSQIIDDNGTVPPGTEGVVVGGTPATTLTPRGQIWVEWDGGAKLALLPGYDEYEVVG